MGTRRVVTGQGKDGRSIVMRDDEVEARHTSVLAFTSLWGDDTPPSFPHDGSQPHVETLFPGPGGYRFFTWTLAPHSVSAPTDDELDSMPPDVRHHLEGDEPGMHTTDSVDLEICLSGEASMELDDGITIHLKAGDYLVQNGTRHRWFNRGDEPCIIAGVIIGGHPRR